MIGRLGDDVRRELDRFGPAGDMVDLVSVWPDAVGEVVASNAWPARISRDGTLNVNTSSSTWAFELGQLAPAIATRLHELLGEGAPKALRFSVGHVPELAADGLPRPPHAPPEVTPEHAEEADRLAAGIESEELRRTVARAAALSLATAAAGRPF